MFGPRTKLTVHGTVFNCFSRLQQKSLCTGFTVSYRRSWFIGKSQISDQMVENWLWFLLFDLQNPYPWTKCITARDSLNSWSTWRWDTWLFFVSFSLFQRCVCKDNILKFCFGRWCGSRCYSGNIEAVGTTDTVAYSFLSSLRLRHCIFFAQF